LVSNEKRWSYHQVESLVWRLYGRLAKKEMLYSIGKEPNREATILSSFDKLWGAKEVMCVRLDKKVF
jgi:hypothetical protein